MATKKNNKDKKERISFSHQDVVECLIKKQDIHEGIWAISIGFGFGAGNIADPQNEENLLPAGIMPISNIGIERVDEHQANLSVDASLVNPLPKSNSKTKK